MVAGPKGTAKGTIVDSADPASQNTIEQTIDDTFEDDDDMVFAADSMKGSIVGSIIFSDDDDDDRPTREMSEEALESEKSLSIGEDERYIVNRSLDEGPLDASLSRQING